MADQRVERRLAAILAADVVGYSRLMGADEVGTLAAFRAHRKALIDPKIDEYHGRIVKTTGGGMLVEFASVVDAVQCAVEVQRGMVERNADVPRDKRIEFRVGINLGDIIVDGADIHGDGVNIAARLESLADPGAICLSQSAADQVRDKLDITLQDMGEKELKNITRPVRVFRVAAPFSTLSNGHLKTRIEHSPGTAKNKRRIILAGIAVGAVAILVLIFQHPEELPDVTLRVVEPKDPGLVLVNQSGVVAQDIKWTAEIWNLDDPKIWIMHKAPPDAHDNLPIPVGTFDFIKPYSSSGVQLLFETPLIIPSLKPGNRLFGTVGVNCPKCIRGHAYIVYIIWGEGGWFWKYPDQDNVDLVLPKSLTIAGHKSLF